MLSFKLSLNKLDNYKCNLRKKIVPHLLMLENRHRQIWEFRGHVVRKFMLICFPRSDQKGIFGWSHAIPQPKEIWCACSGEWHIQESAYGGFWFLRKLILMFFLDWIISLVQDVGSKKVQFVEDAVNLGRQSIQDESSTNWYMGGDEAGVVRIFFFYSSTSRPFVRSYFFSNMDPKWLRITREFLNLPI